MELIYIVLLLIQLYVFVCFISYVSCIEIIPGILNIVSWLVLLEDNIRSRFGGVKK